MITDDPLPDSGHHFNPSVAIHTVGCKVNQAESESLKRRFFEAGFNVVSPRQKPDAFILNTCTVTHIADRKCRQYLRAFHRRNPDSLIVAIGCYVDRDRNGVAIEGVDMVATNAEKHQLVSMVKDRLSRIGGGVAGSGINPDTDVSRTRSMVKIQEGCSHGCSYCIVPMVRGPEKSTPAEAVIADIRTREQEGFQEVVLTGTRIGKYGDGIGLEGLMQRILRETKIPRIRLSSLQPGEISESLIDLLCKEDRVCHHLHLALQSGCEETLKRMKRNYTIDEYVNAVDRIRSEIPDIAITTDIITGFPGETDDEFEESFRVCVSIGFANMHVFPYSVRTHTPAANLPDNVPSRIIKARSSKMIQLAKQNAKNFRNRFLGQQMLVLWEERRETGLWAGHTSNYIKVYTSTDQQLRNQLTTARLICEYRDQVWCDIHSALEPVEIVIKGV